MSARPNPAAVGQRAAKLQAEAKNDRQFADAAASLAEHLARLRVARRRQGPRHTPGPESEGFNQ